MAYCPRCRTKYNEPTDVCRYCDIPLVEQLPMMTLADHREGSAGSEDEEYVFDVPDDEHEKPIDLAAMQQAAEDQVERARLLNRYLLLRVFWFTAWVAAGFFTAYLLTPDDASEGMKLLIHAAFIAATLILANLVLKIKVGHDLPDPDDTGT
jgi:hypothetical protein